VTDCERGVERWNKAIREVGVDFELRLPSRRFHRQIGHFGGHTFDPDGNLIDAEAFEKRRSDWLPSSEDETYIATLMRPVCETGKVANWISPPRKGINGKPFAFEYVRTER
jgi:benzoyl-CoA 2,3-dioxygenase component B